MCPVDWTDVAHVSRLLVVGSCVRELGPDSKSLHDVTRCGAGGGEPLCGDEFRLRVSNSVDALDDSLNSVSDGLTACVSVWT